MPVVKVMEKQQHKHFSARDSGSESPWQHEGFTWNTPEIDINKHYDVLIAGAGITGLTTALMLQAKGKTVVIAEAGNAGFGTTGGTSAHLNTFFDATYPEIEKDFGPDAARLVARCGREAMNIIKGLSEQFGIACDLEEKDAFVFAEDDKQSEQLADILKSSKAAGLMAEEVLDTGVPIPFTSAVRFEGQGQFHPMKYLNGLVAAFIQQGGILLENTPVTDVTFEEDHGVVATPVGNICVQDVVYATHIPPGVNLLSFRCAPYRSYVLGVRLIDDNYARDLVYDMQEPYHYIRTHIIGGKRILLVGGEDHKTGHDDPEAAYKALEEYVRRYYKVEEVVYRWSSQYYVPVDGLPYIGRMPLGNAHIYIATGYNGNGMMFGTIAGQILSDELTGKANVYGELFDPSRVKPVAGFTEFIKENADVAYHFVADRFGAEELEVFADLPRGKGEIRTYEGRKLAVYKDDAGKIHALNPVCTHAGCIVNFNVEEKSWDCPCHGGRFDIDGNVLNGPPQKPLAMRELG